ncbi:MAG: CCA tRNA nucleotidyltransferase [Pseudomonadota bacterium]
MSDIYLKQEDAYFLQSEDAKYILSLLRRYHSESYFVGGCVRNAVMGLSQSSDDIDIATALKPDDVIKTAKAHGIYYVPTGLKHGTITLIYNERQFEVTTFRSDVKTDGRHAEVQFEADYKQDAYRRDFTINAIYCDGDGILKSPVGGIEDAHCREVRFIGNAEDRIKEDYLRILRYYRFISYFGTPDDVHNVSKTIKKLLVDMRRPATERNITELRKTLHGAYQLDALNLMEDYGVFEAFFGTTSNVKKYQAILQKTARDAEDIPFSLKIALLCDFSASDDWKSFFKLTRQESKAIDQLRQLCTLLSQSCDIYEQLSYKYDYDLNIYNIAVENLAYNQTLSEEDAEMLIGQILPYIPFNIQDTIKEGFKGKTIKEEYIKRRLNFLKETLSKA